MGTRFRIALEYCARLLAPFEVRGRSEHRCSYAFRRLIGSRGAGTFSNRLNSRGN